MTKPIITPNTVKSWLLTASFALECLSMSVTTRGNKIARVVIRREVDDPKSLTYRDESEKEDTRPYILDYRRPYFRCRELSREYSGFAHGELESWNRRSEREGGLEQWMLCFKYPSKDRLPTACRLATKPLHFRNTSRPRGFSRMLCGANLRRSDPCSDFGYPSIFQVSNGKPVASR